MFRNILPFLAACALTLVSCNTEQIYSAKDFGIVPDSGEDMSALMNQALEKIRQKEHDGPVTLRLDPGAYDFYPENSSKKDYYISNHDQGTPKHIAIDLEGLENFTLDGQGADIWFHGRMIPLSLVDCEKVHIKNLSIDSRMPQIAQAEVLANENGQITYRLDEAADYRVAGDTLYLRGHGWEFSPLYGMAFEKETKHIVYRTSDVYIAARNVREIAPRTFQAAWENGKLIPGTMLTLRPEERPTPGIFISESKDITLEKVRVHFADGMGLLAQVSENISLDGFQVALRAGSGRYFTTQADATHFSGCKGKIISKNGLYENMMDDAINVHGTYLRITERLDDHHLVGRYMHYQTYGFFWGEAGDEVQFIQSRTMETCGSNRMTAIEPYGQDEIKGCKEFLITCEEVLPEDIADGHHGIENLEWTPEVLFADNIVRNNRARGALFSTPKKTVVENNLFDHTSGTAILLCGDCNGWFETGACREVLIRNNRFVNALTNMFQFTNAVISIYPKIPDLEHQVTYFHGGDGKGVVIEDNVFETFDHPLVYAKSLDGLVFRNNEIIRNNDYPAFHWNKEPILLERVINADIEL